MGRGGYVRSPHRAGAGPGSGRATRGALAGMGRAQAGREGGGGDPLTLRIASVCIIIIA